jgi:hypothetical protein
VTLDFGLARYSWHGKHHVAHLTALQERKGWHSLLSRLYSLSPARNTVFA